MNQIYRYCRISKQNFHQRYDRMIALEEIKHQLIPLIMEIRKDHPRMAAREIYFKLNPPGMGRDRFEHFAYEYGFKLKKVKSYRLTTDSLGVRRFPNLITDFDLNAINQVWVSDITYYELNDQFYYITIIMDLYSRFILAGQLSKDLRTINTTIPALQQAIKYRSNTTFNGLIFHSDGGGQYYCKEFIDMTNRKGIINSMAEVVYENAYVERVHGTIKNDYLIPYGPKNPIQLKKAITKAIYMYNYDRPHSSLGRITPYQFELNTCSTDKKGNDFTELVKSKTSGHTNTATHTKPLLTRTVKSIEIP